MLGGGYTEADLTYSIVLIRILTIGSIRSDQDLQNCSASNLVFIFFKGIVSRDFGVLFLFH
jgi:hypothetical protein